MAAYFSNHRQQITPNVSILSEGDSIHLHSWRPSIIYAVLAQWKTVIIFFVLFVLNAFFSSLAHSGAFQIGRWSPFKLLFIVFVFIPFIAIPFIRGLRSHPLTRKYLNWFFFAFVVWFVLNVFIFGKNATSQAIRTSIWNIIIAAFVLTAVYRILRIRAIQYMLTNEQIVARQGLLSKTAHYIELYRVKDIIVHQSFMERTFGLMNLSIISIDAATPVFTLQGLPYTPELQLQIRNLAQQCRMRYNVYSIN